MFNAECGGAAGAGVGCVLYRHTAGYRVKWRLVLNLARRARWKLTKTEIGARRRSQPRKGWQSRLETEDNISRCCFFLEPLRISKKCLRDFRTFREIRCLRYDSKPMMHAVSDYSQVLLQETAPALHEQPYFASVHCWKI